MKKKRGWGSSCNWIRGENIRHADRINDFSLLFSISFTYYSIFIVGSLSATFWRVWPLSKLEPFCFFFFTYLASVGNWGFKEWHHIDGKSTLRALFFSFWSVNFAWSSWSVPYIARRLLGLVHRDPCSNADLSNDETLSSSLSLFFSSHAHFPDVSLGIGHTPRDDATVSACRFSFSAVRLDKVQAERKLGHAGLATRRQHKSCTGRCRLTQRRCRETGIASNQNARTRSVE